MRRGRVAGADDQSLELPEYRDPAAEWGGASVSAAADRDPRSSRPKRLDIDAIYYVSFYVS